MRSLMPGLKRWFRPSLGGRLLLTQLMMLVMLWTMLVTASFYAAYNDDYLLATDPVLDLILSVSDNLADAPVRQKQSLAAIDRKLRLEYGDGADESRFAPIFFVRQNGELIYQSSPQLPPGRDRQLEVIEKVNVDGATWRMRTRRSEQTGTEVSFAIPTLTGVLITFNSRGYYLLPLLISLPFLAFPAWWSIRLALRPWRRLSDEISMRGPEDLSPLGFKASHSELKPFVTSINTLLARVQKSALRERSLIADAAHELRTPLAAMRVNVEALRQQTADPRQRQLMDSLLRSNQRATRMVQQLLQLMRSEAAADGGGTQVMRIDSMVQDRLAELDTLAATRSVELELEIEASATPMLIHAEPEGMASLVDNLVDNAIKYSPPGGIVTVQVQVVQAQVVLSVSDAGPGIAPEMRERVFNRFFRAPDQVQSGSGLGLSIVQNVVTRHGGTISLHASARGGLLCRVTLNLATQPAAVSAALASGRA